MIGRKFVTRFFAVMLCCFLVTTQGVAEQTVAGVKVADTVSVAGNSLLLNGVGIRKATFLRIKVYVASLYVEQKDQDPETLISNNSTLLLHMDFVRSVSAKKLRGAWSEGFEKAPAYTASMKSKVDAFNAAMKDVSEGDRIAILFKEESVELTMPGGAETEIEGAGFRKALLQIWLGPEPPNADLKDGMLGK